MIVSKYLSLPCKWKLQQ